MLAVTSGKAIDNRMATTTSSGYFPFKSDGVYAGGQDGSTGDANSGPASAADGNAAGASGTDTGGLRISHGGMAAIIVVVVIVALIGSE
jgi:hypothetical protein